MSVTRVWNGVRSHSVIRSSAAAVAALSLATLGLAGTALAQTLNYDSSRSNISRDTDPDPILENRQPLPGWGIFGLSNTEASFSDPAGQSSDGFAISRWVSGGFFAGALSSGFFDSQPDNILGFSVTGSGSTPATLSITRNLTLTGDAVSGYDTFGLGNIPDDGLIAFRTDGGSGGTVPNFIGEVGVYEAGPSPFSLAQVSAATTTTQSVPARDIDSGTGRHVTLWTAFDRTIHSAADGIAEQVERTATAPADFRGSVTYNGTAGKAAVFGYDGTSGIANVTSVKIYQVSVNTSGSGDVVLTDVVSLSLPSGTVGTNYFSRTAFAGTHQIAMNDNGDIAVPVVVGTNASNAVRREILFAKWNGLSYDAWQTVVDSGATGTGNGFTTANPVTGNGLAISSPALDNDDNVYFASTSFISGNGTTVPYNTSQAIYALRATVSGGGITWSAPSSSQLLRTGDDFHEKWVDSSGTLDDQDYRITFIPVMVATSALTNTNSRFNSPASIGPNAIQKGSTTQAGLMVQALAAVKNPDGSLGAATQKYLYITPGNATP